ncbi:hypothetical protein FHX75_111398 [Micromonospora palomenae]|uniref:Uncharacterized protein n=1 Tax=Micromonospora palomenae TaxID=1461247 RepID=A0A561WWJ6_9ACTN|nr:hypothetical protein [Micromonospora palomenae]TWG28247.1 hypothetical protein FHX75_111398 [Micromonospora palomenae]
MPLPRVHTPEFIASVVDRVQQHQARHPHGAVTAVAQDLGLNRRLVSAWVNTARLPPATSAPAPVASTLPGDTVVFLPPGLLYCARCTAPMNPQQDVGVLGYQCVPGCRAGPLPAGPLVHQVGRAVLAAAPHLITQTTGAKAPEIGARHADRVLTRVTVGHAAHDLGFIWRSTPVHRPPGSLPNAVHAARTLADADLYRAREVLRHALTAVNPATAGAHPARADTAALLAEVLIRLGHPAVVVALAGYAHRSYTHLHGPTDPSNYVALLATTTEGPPRFRAAACPASPSESPSKLGSS